MVAIMGPSGSGKSTLMHILGLLHAPDTDDGPAPELRFDGVDVTSLSDGERTRIRARSMGFVFQSFNLVPTLTAVENVMLAAGTPAWAASRRGPRPGGARHGSVWPIAPGTGRWSSPAASSSGSPSLGRSSTSRPRCWPTSRPATSTPRDRSKSWRCFGASTGNVARRRSS